MRRIRSRALALPTVGVRLNIYGLLILPFYLGTVYLFSPHRFESPGYDTARSMLPIPAWGVAFLALGLVLAGCMRRSQRCLMKGLVAATALYTLWAGLFAVSATHDEHAGTGIVGLYLFIAWSHFASAQTLATRPEGGPS